jgi:hypothetical protein
MILATAKLQKEDALVVGFWRPWLLSLPAAKCAIWSACAFTKDGRAVARAT